MLLILGRRARTLPPMSCNALQGTGQSQHGKPWTTQATLTTYIYLYEEILSSSLFHIRDNAVMSLM